jgi:hypothetical protein
VLVKLFLGLPYAIEGYHELAAITYELVYGLSKEYLEMGFSLDPERETESVRSTPIYKSLIEWTKVAKSSFHSSAEQMRRTVLSYRVDPALARLNGLLKRFEDRYLDLMVTEAREPTESIAFIQTSILLSQKRPIGYLPLQLAITKRLEYSRLMASVNEVTGQDIKLAVISMLRALESLGIPRDSVRTWLRGHAALPFEEIEEHLALQLAARLRNRVKRAADLDIDFSEYGKLQLAQDLLEKVFGRIIRVYDLETGKEQLNRSFKVDQSEFDRNGFERSLFWISFQIVVNFLSKNDPSLPYFDIGTGEYETEAVLCRLVCVFISEGGKERILSKSSGILSWFYGTVSKLLTPPLAESMIHRQGLVGGGDAWNFLMRIGPSSRESSRLWKDGQRVPFSELFFTDWTQASDGLDRETGVAQSSAYATYVGCPKFLWALTQTMLRVNQTVSESFGYVAVGQSEPTAVYSHSYVQRRGFAMGLPLTKLILHLNHCSIIELGRDQVVKQSNNQSSLLLSDQGERTQTSALFRFRDPVGSTESEG